MRTLLTCVLAALLAACGDLEVRSIPGSQTIPAELAGMWSGTWRSDANQEAGGVMIRIQEFEGEPVVSLTIDNPCLVPADYDLVFDGGVIALQADGVTVLQASLVAPRKLSGSYGCALDAGTWDADWVGALPEPIDLSGVWDGTAVSVGGMELSFSIDLEQSVQSGTLALAAQAELPSLLPFPVPLSGYVNFREDSFELVLQTELGVQPRLVLTGVGERDPLQVPTGLLQVIGQSPLPFQQGLFAMEPR